MTTTTKGVIMTIVALLATTLSTTGLPATVTGWEYLAITTVGTVLLYLGKNAVFPSISLLGTVDLRDVLSSIFVALSSGLSGFVASAVTSKPVNWHELLTLMGVTIVGYFAKNFATDKP